MKKCLALLIAVVMLSSLFIVPTYAVESKNATVSYYDDDWDGGDDWDNGGDDEEPTEPSVPVNAYSLTVNGEYFTNDKLTISCGNGTASFNPNTNTLTLDNAELSKTPSSGNFFRYAAIGSAISDLTVVFKGKTVYDEGRSDNYFLCSSGKVTFTGDGTTEMYKTEAVEHEEFNEEEYRWESYYTYESLQTDVKMEINADVTFDHIKAYRFFITNTKSGDLTVRNATLTRCDLTFPGSAAIENATIQSEQYRAKITNIINYYRSSIKSRSLTVLDSTLAQTEFAVQTDTALNNVKMDYASVQSGGSLTAQNVKSYCTERTQTEYQDRYCVLSAKRMELKYCDLKYTNIRKYSDSSDTVSVTDSRLEDSSLIVYADTTIDSCIVYGTDMEIYGDLTFQKTTVDAKFEGQNSRIECYGADTNVINCNFKGIAETKQGERQVSLGNGIPATELFSYYTFSGASFEFPYTENVSREVRFTDSLMMLDHIYTTDPAMKLYIDNTRMIMCTGDFNSDEYDYDANITLIGNIDIVNGYWGSSRETGIMIDRLGDYYTFDEATGELHLYNDYGVRAWDQLTYFGYENGKPVLNHELIEKVKKVVIGSDVTESGSQWFTDYKNLKEIDNEGQTDTWFDYHGCSSIGKITIGQNVIDMGPNPQDAPTLKTLVYKSDFSYENEYYDIDYLIRYKYSYDSSLPKPAIEKIFVPPATIERWKRNVANEYKDKILPLYLLGDVDGNCDIEIRDATFIQRKIAGINLPFTFNKKTADVDGNNDITIMDVTFFTKASGTYESIVQNRRAGILK